jgi:hypothetical protein
MNNMAYEIMYVSLLLSEGISAIVSLNYAIFQSPLPPEVSLIRRSFF